MGRSNSNQNKQHQITDTSTKRYPKKRKNSLNNKKFKKGKFDERIHRGKQSTSQATNDTINITFCFEKENIENEHLYDEEECMIGEDQEYLIEHIQILLDSHPKCSFIEQILQKLCNDGTLTEDIIAHLIDRSIQKQTEIQKQINSLKSNHIKKIKR
ncbi:hypothetical protein ACH3XW_2260 [Acanthocheilonema viteae]